MGQVEQIVDDELPVGRDVEIAAFGPPVGVIEPMEIGDLVRIGERRIAHPYPQPAIPLDHRIAFDLRRRRYGVLARHLHASAGAVISQAMVVALQMIADELSHGKRQVAVDAAVLERGGRAVLFAEKHDRLAEDHPPERLACNLVLRGGDVPEIFQEHGRTSLTENCIVRGGIFNATILLGPRASRPPTKERAGRPVPGGKSRQ